jgi:uncharacterized iron-regulated membrane protein
MPRSRRLQVIGLLLPLLGLSLLLVALADRALPVAAPRVGAWLGLRRQLRS